MAKQHKTPYRARFDGHRRLAAAVILQAIKDLSQAASQQDRDTAAEFLGGDMWPFSDVLGLPTDGTALRTYLKKVDLVIPRISR